jgi:excisionase family DNA binding protein
MNPRHAAVLSPVMTLKEVAEYLHIHQSTLYKLIRLSEIPSFKIGSEHRFRRNEIEEWIAEKQLPQERSK